MDRKQRCDTCRWWNTTSDDPDPFNQCRARSPSLVDRNDQAIFPITQLDHWCGHWKTKDQGETESCFQCEYLEDDEDEEPCVSCKHSNFVREKKTQ